MVAAEEANVLAFLTRAPSAGGKTRLFSALDRASDPDLLAAFLLDTLDNASTPGVKRVVAVTPPTACAEIQSIVPPDVVVIAQQDGTLGDRMRSTMAGLFASGAGAVALVGSDLPTITPDRVGEAFALLAREPHALVLGPSADGGYYLIAATVVPDVFNDIAWGTDQVLAQTQDTARAAGLTVHLLDALADIDTLETLFDCRNHPHAIRTAQWLRTHGC